MTPTNAIHRRLLHSDPLVGEPTFAGRQALHDGLMHWLSVSSGHRRAMVAALQTGDLRGAATHKQQALNILVQVKQLQAASEPIAQVA